jgi:hypothetical protein
MSNTPLEVVTDKYALYRGDCAELIKQIPDNSLHYSVSSPPCTLTQIQNATWGIVGILRSSRAITSS